MHVMGRTPFRHRLMTRARADAFVETTMSFAVIAPSGPWGCGGAMKV